MTQDEESKLDVNKLKNNRMSFDWKLLGYGTDYMYSYSFCSPTLLRFLKETNQNASSKKALYLIDHDNLG